MPYMIISTLTYIHLYTTASIWELITLELQEHIWVYHNRKYMLVLSWFLKDYTIFILPLRFFVNGPAFAKDYISGTSTIFHRIHLETTQLERQSHTSPLLLRYVAPIIVHDIGKCKRDIEN